MQRPIISSLRRWNAFILPYALTLFVTFSALAVLFTAMWSVSAQAKWTDGQIPHGWESYLTRPDILSPNILGAGAQSQLQTDPLDSDRSWVQIRNAHFSFVASLLEFYPDEDIYFLARDSEYLYDVAKLATEGTEEANRIHLLNISRANMKGRLLKSYLNENGITESGLRDGKKIVFIDTGFYGSVEKQISRTFSRKARPNIKTHFILSLNPMFPSSLTFLIWLDALANKKEASSMKVKILNYEHMHRFTSRSTQFASVGGQIHPISRTDYDNTEFVSKEKALLYMQNIKKEWQKDSVREKFQFDREKTKRLIAVLVNQPSETAVSEIRKILEEAPLRELPFYEALIRDIFAAQKNMEVNIDVNLKLLGFRDVLDAVDVVDAFEANREERIRRFPKWSIYLSNPSASIKEFFAQEDWAMIKEFIDANIDDEINFIIIKHLYDEKATGVKHYLQKMMIEKASPHTLQHLAEQYFTRPYYAQMSDLISLLKKTTDQVTLSILSENNCNQLLAN
ncbi:MAG: hypothetical protein KDD38_08695 [Bdellovibrionales bacterium]|nr:hypothetical protein [Bdellovibrionales bacterium]